MILRGGGGGRVEDKLGSGGFPGGFGYRVGFFFWLGKEVWRNGGSVLRGKQVN